MTTVAVLERLGDVRLTREIGLRLAGLPKVKRVIAPAGIHELDPHHLMRRLLNRAVINDATGCWLWRGGRNWAGYGGFTVAGRTRPAHIIAYILATGIAPAAGIDVMHRCDNPPCINPDHLSLGTRSDNMRDCSAKGRLRAYRGGVRGERNGNARLTWEKVREIRLRAARGEYHYKIAADYGVSDGAIDLVVNGTTWKEPHPSEVAG